MNYQVCDQRKNEDAYMYEDEAEILGSGEGLQMSRGSCMRSHMVWFGMVWYGKRSHMKEREMSMDAGITLKSRRV